MSLKGFRRLDRGEVSIFAAFVLVVILAGVGLFVQSFSPNAPQGQTAQAAAPVPQSVPAAVTQARAGVSQACQAQIQAAIASGTGQSPPLKQPFKKNATENNKCVGAVLKTGATDKTKPESYRCTGENTLVLMNKTSGQGSIVSVPDTSDPPKVLEGKCLTRFCDVDATGKPGVCSAGTLWDGSDSMQKWALSGDTFSTLSFDQKSTVLTNVAGVDSTDQQYLSNFLAQNQTTAGQDAATLKAAADSCTGGNCQVNAQIAQLAQSNGATCTQTADGYSCDAASLQQASKNAQLTQEQLKNLATAQVPLVPTGQTCPNGGTPPGCVPPGGCTTLGCSGAVPTGNGTGNNTFNGNGLSGLLSGLSRGLASSPTSPAAPAQACSTDPNAYAQQQQQYQQQLQQYNYQLQQYQYQQQYNQYGGYSSAAPPPQPTPCSPSTQGQCSLQPQQPAASTCTAGSWQPVYSGNCIVNWQCSNLGAQLSCSPTTADVGMSLAISYSCAQGTATGQGFTASSTSGTTTVQIAAPPAGANTATYGLTCTAGNQTSGAQCSVQVTQPSIVLVANPATVSSGQTSQLGWVTTGMQSCVISSPQDATFTAQNASNTSVNGTAVTVAASSTTGYLLHCQTLAGGTKDATTTVTVQ